MSELKRQILAGLSGEKSGLSNGLERINKYIFNIQRSCYYLLGGVSGSAKTTFLDFMLLNAIQDAEKKGIDINIFYYSWEMSKPRKQSSWLSMLIYKKYGVIIPPAKINGLGEERLTLDEQAYVFGEIPEIERIFDKINWIWEAQNPYGMYHDWWGHMKKRGEIKYEDYFDEDNIKRKRVVGYTSYNPKEYNLVVGDHLALAKVEKGNTIKQNIDKISEYCVITRNLFNMTHIWLQQFNQALHSVERAKFKGVDISPQQGDFKDSTNPYADKI